MRIISGLHRRRTLYVPSGFSVRPTREKVREAVLNILRYGRTLGNCVEGACVLDVCCGTGAYGLEALSQGARLCTFLDKSRSMLDCAYRNTEKLGEGGRSNFFCVDARALPLALRESTLVFLDPPYTTRHLSRMIASLTTQGWIAYKGILVVETSKSKAFSWSDLYTLVEERIYGESRISFLQKTFYETDRYSLV